MSTLDGILDNISNRSIVLVGLMGAGKTCVGRQLSSRLSLPFVDADHEIESAAGCSIEDIFELYGEKEFRDGEVKVIKRLLGNGPQILATGGGAFMNEETRQSISEHGISLWLKADLDILKKRTSRRGGRPLLQNSNPGATLQKLIDRRYPIYEMSDITIETGYEKVELTTDKAMTAIHTFLTNAGQDRARL